MRMSGLSGFQGSLAPLEEQQARIASDCYSYVGRSQ